MTKGYRYYFNTSGGNGDNVGELYDSNSSNLVYSDDVYGNQFGFSYYCSQTDWYYLRVRCYSDGSAIWSGYLHYWYTAY